MRMTILALLMITPATFAQTNVPINAERAQSNYRLNCQGCHLADGSGLPGRVPSMRGFVGGFLSVPGGRDFLVQVPGSANSPINDADLAELLNWIVTTMGTEKAASAFEFYSEAEVKQSRKTVLVDVAQVSAELVSKIAILAQAGENAQ